MLNWAVVIVLLGCSTAAFGRSQEESREESVKYCYSCSSKSALCRDEVYDGKYLSVTACKSTCFLRQEANITYRGCFDGWLGGMVEHHYVGCRIQQYLGDRVEWCFCNLDNDEVALSNAVAPCNGASVRQLRRLSELQTGTYGIPVQPIQAPHTEVKDKLSANSLTDIDGSSGKMADYAKERRFEHHDFNEPIGDNGEGLGTPVAITLPFVLEPPRNPCRDRKDGSYPNVTRCQSYLRCFSGKAYHMHCPRGTVWNTNFRRCTYSAGIYARGVCSHGHMTRSRDHRRHRK